MTKPAAVDWERIEADYRAGIKTLREIADEHGITHGAIGQRAKKHGWERDLQAKIKAKADALLSKSVLSTDLSKKQADSERIVVLANAEAVAGVAIRHRTDLRAVRDGAMALLQELLDVKGETLAEVAEVLAQDAPEEPVERRLYMQRLRDAIDRAGALSSRAQSLKSIADTVVKSIDTERVAWKLDKPAEADPLMGKTLTDAERASRLATIMARARAKADAETPPTPPPPAAPPQDATVH